MQNYNQNDSSNLNANQILPQSQLEHDSNNDDDKKYPKLCDNLIKIKKKSISCHNKFLKNPDLSFFTSNSQFIYDIDEGLNYIIKRENPNALKLTKEEKEIFY